jgi:predicted nucleic acid-binding protein
MLMKEKLFVDTWGWIVLLNKREPLHLEVNALYKKARNEAWNIYTTDYVLDETYTLLFRRLPSKAASRAVNLISEAESQGYLAIERISPGRFKKAEDFRLKYHDKPEISFTDITSIIVMKELEIRAVLTNDDHFVYVGMGFKKIP